MRSGLNLLMSGTLLTCFLATSCANKKINIPLHPIFKQKGWIKYNKEEKIVGDPAGLNLVWRVSTYYRYWVGQEIFNKSEHKYFGKQLALRAYEVEDAGSKLLSHWIGIKKEDGKWQIFKTDCGENNCYTFKQLVVRDSDGFVIGVNLLVESKNGELVCRRFVKRKDFEWKDSG